MKGTLAWQLKKYYIDPHGEEFWIIVFDAEKSVVFLLVEICEWHED